MEQELNEPAFPVFPDTPTGRAVAFRGMSLRDYFAAKAMQALATAGKYTIGMGAKPEVTQYAEKAYRMADAMMRARK